MNETYKNVSRSNMSSKRTSFNFLLMLIYSTAVCIYYSSKAAYYNLSIVLCAASIDPFMNETYKNVSRSNMSSKRKFKFLLVFRGIKTISLVLFTSNRRLKARNGGLLKLLCQKNISLNNFIEDDLNRYTKQRFRHR
jgi:hypothetical protein